MDYISECIGRTGILPVIVIDDAKQALPLAKAICDGGVNIIEITFRTPCAQEAIRNIRNGLPQMLVGAGTILSEQQLSDALNAGAEFIVSPGFNRGIVERCLQMNIPIFPGCAIPNDIELALGYKLEVVKIFPAEHLGGVPYIKALSGPYGNMKYIATGGINQDNFACYLEYEKVLAVGGMWMVGFDLLRDEKYSMITNNIRECINAMLGFKFASVHIHPVNELNSIGTARRLSGILGLPLEETSSEYMVGDLLRIGKDSLHSSAGQICIETLNLDRSVRYLKERGAVFEFGTAEYLRGRLNKIKLAGVFENHELALVQR